MDANRIAGWLLELVTSPDRAASIVGDFAEESAGRGRLWFWRQVAQTLLAHIRYEFASAPLRLLLCVPLSLAFFAGWLLGPWEAFYHTFVAKPQADMVPLGQGIIAAAFDVAIGLHYGAILASITKRPLAATFIFAIAGSMTARTAQDRIYGLCLLILVFIGAIWQRRRRLRTV